MAETMREAADNWNDGEGTLSDKDLNWSGSV
jgi:hypothetical protein